MKLEKLMTLSQFVDLRDSKIKHSELDFTQTSLEFLGEIYRYNDFLKQPITKDMFVNEFEYPDESLSGGFATNEEQNEFYDALKQWKQAESKVIFKSVKPVLGVSNDLFINPKYKKPFRDIAIEDYDNLQDLAEETNGELELKNIKL